ncbi:MAG: SDR family oxidoreductase [Actinobacteria bacterium]|nr:SDR family oxidoreductase [Actinomycetota bacterium]
MEQNLKGKNILVTGASRGIGRAVSRAVAGAGANVILTARSEDALSDLKKEILSSGGRAEYITADLESEKEIQDLFSKIGENYSGLDVLINNAGIARAGELVDCPIRDFNMLMNVNLKAVYLCCKHALKMMIAAGSGYIINISSVVGIKGYANQAAYSASKHGVVGLSKALADEVQKYGIRVSLIHPGGVDTDLVKGTRPDLDSSLLLKPEDIAQAVLYLLSLSPRAMVDEIYIRRSLGKPF